MGGNKSDDRVELRKRKRMQSNRESARRSRMRKQKHLDDLTAQVAQLKEENNQISTRVALTTQHYANTEAENSVLRAQMVELSHWLQSLNQILLDLQLEQQALPDDNNNNNTNNNFFNNPWNNTISMAMGYTQYPIMAASEMFDY